MDQGYDNPFHIICCFRKQPVSFSPSGSALKRVYWEWGGGASGILRQTAWHGACGLNGQPASPEKAYVPGLHGSEEGYWMQRSRQDWAEQVTDGWFILLQSWKGMRLLFFLPIMGGEDANSALSTLNDASFLKLWNTIYKKRTTFQEPLISTRMHFFFP